VSNQALAGSQVAAPPQAPTQISDWARRPFKSSPGSPDADHLPRCAETPAQSQNVQPGHSVTVSKGKHLPAVLTAATGATAPIL